MKGEPRCKCGHAKTVHPFGISEALTFNGSCQLCECRTYEGQSSEPRQPSLDDLIAYAIGYCKDSGCLGNQSDGSCADFYGYEAVVDWCHPCLTQGLLQAIQLQRDGLPMRAGEWVS